MTLVKTVRPLFLIACLVCSANTLTLAAEPQVAANKKALWAAVAHAKTVEDHLRLAAYYRDRAEKLQERQRRAEESARYYLKYAINYRKQYPTPYENSEFLADYYRRAADDALAVAAAREEIAKEIDMETQE